MGSGIRNGLKEEVPTPAPSRKREGRRKASDYLRNFRPSRRIPTTPPMHPSTITTPSATSPAIDLTMSNSKISKKRPMATVMWNKGLGAPLRNVQNDRSGAGRQRKR